MQRTSLPSLASPPDVAVERRTERAAEAKAGLGRALRQCLGVTLALLVLCCAIYPAIVTGLAQAIFPAKANGSLVVRDGVVRGSELLGQNVAEWGANPAYFWGRPSAASTTTDGIVVSGGSNLGPSNPALHEAVEERIATLRATGVTGPIPIDLVTSSASGLDPHLSPEATAIQVPRVAKARGLSEDEVRAMIAKHTEGATWGFLGEPRVNVTLLNLALDDRAPIPAR